MRVNHFAVETQQFYLHVTAHTAHCARTHRTATKALAMLTFVLCSFFSLGHNEWRWRIRPLSNVMGRLNEQRPTSTMIGYILHTSHTHIICIFIYSGMSEIALSTAYSYLVDTSGISSLSAQPHRIVSTKQSITLFFLPRSNT